MLGQNHPLGTVLLWSTWSVPAPYPSGRSDEPLSINGVEQSDGGRLVSATPRFRSPSSATIGARQQAQAGCCHPIFLEWGID